MKKIFLVTWFTSENYGTCLQAYATNYILTEAGHEVCFLNRRTYYPLSKIKFLIPKILGSIKTKLKKKKGFDYGEYETGHLNKVKKIQNIIKETYKIKNISSKTDVDEIDRKYDCYLVGSDQMWNPWVVRPQYLLDFVPDRSIKPKYSYAASFGVDKLPDDKIRLYRKYLSRFIKISVREEKAVEIVKDVSGKQSTLVLDPTFLLEQEEWRKFAMQSTSVKDHDLQDYVICYFLGDVYDHMTTVKAIAQKLGLKTAIIAMKESDYKIHDSDVTVIADACPYDFISLIDNARLVCTDSFHAVVFSFQMNTPFYYYPRFKVDDPGSQDTRLHNIMKRFKLTESVWKDEYTIEDMNKHLVPDYSDGYSVLEKERKYSLSYLLNMIEG